MKIDSSGGGYAALASQKAREDLRADMRIGGEPGIKEIGSGGASSPKLDEVKEAGGFGAILEKTAMAASAKEHNAVAKAEALAAGTSDDLHGTMITMKEAEISMKLVGSVRDKLMDAFHELWRINV